MRAFGYLLSHCRQPQRNRAPDETPPAATKADGVTFISTAPSKLKPTRTLELRIKHANPACVQDDTNVSPRHYYLSHAVVGQRMTIEPLPKSLSAGCPVCALTSARPGSSGSASTASAGAEGALCNAAAAARNTASHFAVRLHSGHAAWRPSVPICPAKICSAIKSSLNVYKRLNVSWSG